MILNFSLDKALVWHFPIRIPRTEAKVIKTKSRKSISTADVQSLGKMAKKKK